MTRASEADPEKLISGVVKDINVSDGEVDVVLRISAYDRVRLRKGEKVNLQL
jgi:hypothetical protein